jgi:hypothetical protein
LGNPRSSSSSSLRVLAALLIVGCFALGGTVAGALLYVRHVFQTTVTKAAQVAGIKLNLGQVSYGVGFVQLFDSQFELTKVPGVNGHIKRIDLDWVGLRPSKLLFSGLSVYTTREPVELYRSLLRYTDQLRRLKLDSNSKSRPVDFEIRHLELHGKFTHPLLSTVDLTEVELKRKVGKSKDQTSLVTNTTRVNGTEFGPLSLVFRNNRGQIELGWGKTLEESDGIVTYREDDTGMKLATSFKPVALTALFARFGQTTLPEAFAKASLSGTVTAQFSLNTGNVTVKTVLLLTDFVPPHPAELKGYAFKDKTLLVATLQSEPLYSLIEVPVLELTNGELKLRGTGRIERKEPSARLLADLSAKLDCVNLAKGFAQDEVGGALGQWGQRTAVKAVRGSVDVRIQVEADTAKLAEAKVVKRIGIGCGLRPLALQDLLTLELPPPPDEKAAERLVKLMTKPGKMPLSPGLLPSLDELIDVNLKAK